ncbi:MAG: hypothetical protein HQK81_12060 [Desulfovibrionaceae bacterium]|nr:hypothetical protein [Desulfovibrionaceae bacterium]
MFVIASSTKIVLQSLSVKNDILIGAICITLLMSVLNLTQEKASDKHASSFDLFYIFAASSFALSVKYYFAAFLVVFSAAFFVANADLRPAGLTARLRRYGNAQNASLILLAFASFCLTMIYAWANFRRFGSPFGPESFVQSHNNQDGIAGAFLNALRYAAELIDLPIKNMTEGLVSIVNHAAGPSSRIGTLFDFAIDADFSRRFRRPNEDFCTFGLPATLVAFAATIFAVFRARGYIRRAALIPPALFVCFCFTLAWMPWNLRFFSLIFACAVPSVAFLLDSLSRRRLVLICISLLAAANLVFALAFNEYYGLFNPYPGVFQGGSPGPFPYWLHIATNRLDFYNAKTGFAMKQFVADIRDCKGILFVGDQDSHLFPLLLAAQNVKWRLELPGSSGLFPAQGVLPAAGAPGGDPRDQYDLIVTDKKSLTSLSKIAPDSIAISSLDADLIFLKRVGAGMRIDDSRSFDMSRLRVQAQADGLSVCPLGGSTLLMRMTNASDKAFVRPLDFNAEDSARIVVVRARAGEDNQALGEAALPAILGPGESVDIDIPLQAMTWRPAVIVGILGSVRMGGVFIASDDPFFTGHIKPELSECLKIRIR